MGFSRSRYTTTDVLCVGCPDSSEALPQTDGSTDPSAGSGGALTEVKIKLTAETQRSLRKEKADADWGSPRGQSEEKTLRSQRLSGKMRTGAVRPDSFVRKLAVS